MLVLVLVLGMRRLECRVWVLPRRSKTLGDESFELVAGRLVFAAEPLVSVQEF